MAEEFERIFIIPLKKTGFKSSKAAPVAVKRVKQYLTRHMKVEDENIEITKKIENPVEKENEKVIEVPTSVVNSNIFKDFKSIDDETAMLLIQNGFDSVEALFEASNAEIMQIVDINKKKVKEIKKELKENLKNLKKENINSLE